MKRFSFAFFLVFSWLPVVLAQPRVTFVSVPNVQKVDVLFDGTLFTSFIYSENLKKPVLWPVITAGGNEITRNYPLKIKAGERADHPHHVGIWFNYGDVNGLDFWNNSETVPAERAGNYGAIYHQSVDYTEEGKGTGRLNTNSLWKDNQGEVLLEETAEFTFSVQGNARIIDRISTLKAVSGDVKMTDNKEGMFAIRVARELELPASGKIRVTGAQGNVVEADASAGLTSGNYLSSEGITGEAVWGTRARWMKLQGIINGERVAIVIFDHRGNAGFPAYWHARGYGLFAANPLGQKIFSNGAEEMNFVIKNEHAATFRYRLAVFSGDPSVEGIENLAKSFQNKL
ncbi:MAG TPA: hypothetical protein ENN90_00770 [Mariniphaga anaerophila]|uniref:Methane oxygenase PmoA n=1 Tax=Mariniphaga anaerophila TaxID=1484053 RepID=A0A831LUP1_9BACT|nr:hypothetical protein [Mariniphaga anaerophila]